MRIMFVLTRSDAMGGASIHVRDMASALLADGHHVRVLLGGTGPVAEELARRGIETVNIKHLVRPVAPLSDLRAVREIASAMLHWRPDVVSAHTSKAGLLARFAGAALRVPVLYTPHCWSFTDGFPGAGIYLLAEKVAAPFGPRIVAVSEAERQEALAARVCAPERIVTIRNGMPEAPGAALSEPAREPAEIVMVGRFEAQKDQATLMRALSGLLHLQWNCSFIGGGPQLEEHRELASALGIVERTLFLPPNTPVASALSGSQIFALITNWESFPRSILEAMRAGLPVVATGVGGVAESVADGETGYVVPRGDEGVLRDRLAGLIQQPALRAEMGRNGRSRFEAEFRFERMYAETTALYRKLVREPRVRSMAVEARGVGRSDALV